MRVRGSRAYRAPQDSHLVALVAEGDATALEALYDRYGEAAWSLALRILADQSLAEAVVREVFLSLWREARRFDPARGTVATYLLSTTHHRAVDMVRREENLRRRHGPEKVLALAPDEPSGLDDEVEVGGLIRSRIRTALAGLPEPQREALMLAYFGGYTQREIASLAGVPLDTVKARMAAGMRRLKDELREAGRQEQFPWTPR
ncbi:MAG TPA: sigma-70 family RNA polymerase sigma factor [Actinomycetes bacterium]